MKINLKIYNFAKKFCLLVSPPTTPTFLTNTIRPHPPSPSKNEAPYSDLPQSFPPKNKHTTVSSGSAALLHSPVANIS